MQARQRDLRGAGEVQAVRLDLVDVRLVGGERAGPDQRLLAHEHGREDGHEPLLGQPVERQAVEREREPRRVAEPVPEARAGHASCALHVEAADLDVLAGIVERARLAHTADLLHVVLGRAVGHVGARKVRDPQGEPVALGLGGGELLLGRLQLLLHLLQLLQLLGRGLALQLRLAAQLVDPRHEPAPPLVGLEHRVERFGGALARQRRAVRVGVVAGRFEIDHARESR